MLNNCFPSRKKMLFCFQKSLYLQSFRNKSYVMNFLTFMERLFPMNSLD